MVYVFQELCEYHHYHHLLCITTAKIDSYKHDIVNHKMNSEPNLAYIYLLQDGKDIHTDIFKVGMTVQKGGDSRVLKRLYGYSKDTVVYNIFKVHKNNVEKIEDNIKNIFRSKYALARGSEWFHGCVTEMIKDIAYVIFKFDEEGYQGVHYQVAMQEHSATTTNSINTQQATIEMTNDSAGSGEEPVSCRRCGHTVTTRSNLFKHLRRKKICQPLYENIEPNVLLEELLNEKAKIKTIKCNHCDAMFTTRQAKSLHMKTCKKAVNTAVIMEDVMEDIIEDMINKKLQSFMSKIGTVDKL